MKFERMFTTADKPVADQIKWKTVPALITGADGVVIFEMPAVEVPAHWSQNATNILAQKYLRKAGVPNITYSHLSGRHSDEAAVIPKWLRNSFPLADTTYSSEPSARQIFHRMAGCWAYWGWREGIFGRDGVLGTHVVGD